MRPQYGLLLLTDTAYVQDHEATALAESIKSAPPPYLQALSTAEWLWISVDPTFHAERFHEVPILRLDEVPANRLNGVLIPSRQYAELIFHLFNTSHLRYLPVIAPYLSGLPHRLWLRSHLMEQLLHKEYLTVVEIGCIEHPAGGHFTTRAIAESLLNRGRLITIDLNVFNLKIAQFFCDRKDFDIEYAQGDCLQILTERKAEFQEHPIDFLLLHHMSDYANRNQSIMLETFEKAEALLNRNHTVCFQAIQGNAAVPDVPEDGCLRQYLSQAGYHIELTRIPGAVNPSRWLVVARKRL